MTTWHDQWLEAYHEVNDLGLTDPRGDVLRGLLVQASEMVDEGSGVLVVAVRRECRRIRENQTVLAS